MHMVASTHWTADMVRALPDDGQRYETIGGVLFVSPSPRFMHQLISGRLVGMLHAYLATEPVGDVLAAPGDFEHGPDVLVQPDVVVTDDPKKDRESWPQLDELLLAIEVLSPSSLKTDRVDKRLLYQRASIPTYWIVDIDARAVEVWTPEAASKLVVTDVLRWHPSGATQPLEIRLEELFAR